MKLFQIESWISTIVQNIFNSNNLSPLSLAAIIHAVRGEYLYSLGYKPSALNETPVVHYDHPAYISKQTVDYPQHFPNDTAPVSIISQVSGAQGEGKDYTVPFALFPLPFAKEFVIGFLFNHRKK